MAEMRSVDEVMVNEPIPLEAVRNLCLAHGQAWVVIVARDPAGKMSVTSWGHRAEDKHVSGVVGDRIARLEGEGLLDMRPGDFRLLCEAQWAEERDLLYDLLLRIADQPAAGPAQKEG